MESVALLIVSALAASAHWIPRTSDEAGNEAPGNRRVSSSASAEGTGRRT